MRSAAARAGAAAVAGGLAAAILPATLPAQQQRPPVFRGEAVLVTVDAYPQIDGRIVPDLTAADFQILEDGKPQTIENIEFVRIEPAPGEGARRDPNSLSEMNTLAADPRNRVFVVFLDALHVTVSGSRAIRRPLIDALDRLIGPDDLFGLVTQNTSPRNLTLGRRLTSVEDQLTRYWPWGERNRLGLDPNDPMEDILKACFELKPVPGYPPWYVSDNGQQRFLYQLLIDRRREDRTLTALEGLVDRLAGMREARTVTMVVTDGWRLFNRDRGLANEASVFGPQMPPVGSAGGRVALGDPTGNTYSVSQCTTELIRLADLEGERRLRDLITRANRANVSFYPVTPGGLATFDTPISEASPPDLAEDGARIRARMTGLRTLAENTDGLPIIETNDLGGGMRRIVDDVSAYYLLGYYSTNTRNDGRFRRIEVKVAKPGVNVRARRGYVAPSDSAARVAPAAAAPAAPEGLEEALGPLARLRAGAEIFTRAVVESDAIHVAVEIAGARIVTAPWNAGADVRVTVTPADGSPLPPVTGRIDANQRGVLITVPGLPAADGAWRVMTKVSAGGEAAEDSTEARASTDALLGDAVLYRGRPAASSPLRPVADLQFRRTERVRIEWTLRGDLDARSARLLGRTGQPLAIPVTVTESTREGRRVIAADVNLAPLSAGDFVVELTAGRGTTTTVRLVGFRVIP